MDGAETITAKEIANILNISVRRVQFRAWRDGWPCEVLNARGDRVFFTDQLPPEIKGTLLQRKESSYIKGLVLPARADLDLGQARALLSKFEGAPQWSRLKAEARGEIVEAFERFARAPSYAKATAGRGKKKNLTKAKKDFCRRYNGGNDGLGIAPETYTNIDTITRPSLDRWRGLKRDFGLVGLLDACRNRQSFCQLTLEQKEYIKQLKVEKPHRRPARVIEYLQNKFDELPSPATIRRFIQTWEEENREYVAFLRNPDKWRSDYQAAMGDASAKALYFLHMLEFDNTPADVMCSDGKRYTVTGCVDIFSRKAKTIVVPTSRAQAIANLMRRVILEWGLYDVMIADNGKDYASRHIEVACTALGITQPPLPPFTPEDKPHIERFFRTLSEGLFEELDGFSGHNVAQAQDLRAQRSFAQRMFTKGEVIECRYSAQELQERIDSWLENVYHRREHSGIGMSPELRAGQSTRPVRRIMDERVLDILLAPAGTATVQKSGIHYDNGIFVAVELADVMRQKVQLRRQLSDAGTLYVFTMPPESKFLCIATDTALQGLTVEEATLAKQRQKKRVREQVRAMKVLAKEVGDPMGELLEAKAAESGRVFAFRREEEAESPAITEASKAVNPPEGEFEEFEISDFRDQRAEAKEEKRNDGKDGKVVRLHLEEAPIFESKMERYKYLLARKNVRKLTEKEQGFMEGYEATEEHYRIFVMPYE